MAEEKPKTTPKKYPPRNINKTKTYPWRLPIVDDDGTVYEDISMLRFHLYGKGLD